MLSFSLFSLPFFITLPAPVKIALIMLGGYAFTGVRAVNVKHHHAEARRVVPARPVPADAAPDLKAPKLAPGKPAATVKVLMDVNGDFILDGKKNHRERPDRQAQGAGQGEPPAESHPRSGRQGSGAIDRPRHEVVQIRRCHRCDVHRQSPRLTG